MILLWMLLSHSRLINPLGYLLGIEDHIALDRNPGTEYYTLL